MKVKWAEFDSEGYGYATNQYPCKVNIDDFILLHEGEVLHVCVINNEAHLLIREGKNFATIKATECEIIED